MKRLFQKMFRDMWRGKAQFVSIFIMCFLGIVIYAGIEGVWNGMQVQGEQYFEKTNLSDFWINGVNFTASDSEEIKELDSVDDAQCAAVMDAYLDKDQDKSIRLIANEKNKISKPEILTGSSYKEKEDGLWLDSEYAKIKNLSTGDTVELYYQDKSITAKIQGTVYSPEYISYTGNTLSLMPNHEKYTYGFVSEQTMHLLCGQANYNQIKLKIKDSCDNLQLKKDLKSQLKEKYLSGLDRTEWTGVSNYTNKIEQIKKMSIMFSVVFFLLAFLTIQTTMKRIVKKQRSQIGILKALGFYNYQIKLHYSLYGLFTSVMGVIFGLALAPYLVTPVLLKLQEKFYSMPAWKGEVSYLSYLLSLFMVFLCMLTAFKTCTGIVKELPAHSLRDENTLNGKKIWIEKLGVLWNNMSYDWKWSLRDMFQNKAKTLIGIVGIFGSMMLLMASFGIKDSINEVNKNIYGNQYSYYEKLNFQSIPQEEDIDKIEENLQGEFQWISEKSAEIQSGDSIKNEGLFVFDEGFYVHLEDKANDTLRLPDKGAVLSKKTAEEIGVEKGDVVKVNSGKSIHTTYVSAVVNMNSPQGIFFSKKAWENAGGTFLPNTLLAGNNPNLEEIEQMECIGEITTLEKQRSDSDEVLNNVLMIIFLLLIAAILLSVVILYNLGLLSYTERSREYATLRVLGFYNSEIKNLILKDNIINVFVGWIIGIPIGFLFLNVYVASISTASIQYSAHIKLISVIISSAITIGCSLLVTYIVSRKVARINMVESLKSVE